jgi:hypothetical protein
MSWNSSDFSEATFDLCRSLEEISDEQKGACKDFKGGVLTKNVKEPLVVSPLVNDVPYWFRLEVRFAKNQGSKGRRIMSDAVKAIPYGGLNDSGIDWCADDFSNFDNDEQKSSKNIGCKALPTGYHGQDAFEGRDALSRDGKLSKTGAGSSGFDFTKVCRSGAVAGEGDCPPNPLPGNSADRWGCTRDNVTGLLWELKSASGLQSHDNTYSWFNPDSKVNGGSPGQNNGGYCQESQCDTLSYIKAVNSLKLCGTSDWRLPTKRELLSTVDNGRFNPAADERFFPKLHPENYWSSSPYADQESMAWQVNFKSGEASPALKWGYNPVRLVRGRTATFGLENP